MPEEVEISGNGDVVLAIGGDEIQPSFLPPAQGLKPVGSLGSVEGRSAEVVERDAVGEAFVDDIEEIERGEGAQIKGGKGLKNPIVETDGVEADDQRSLPEPGEQRGKLVLFVGMKGVVSGVVDNNNADPHLCSVIPSSYLGGRAPGFHVKHHIAFGQGGGIFTVGCLGTGEPG